MNSSSDIASEQSAAARCERRLFFGRGTSIPIMRAEELRDLLPSDRRHHYHDGYSMAEAAKVWGAAAAGDRLPCKIAQLIGSDALCSAHFEYPVTVWVAVSP